MFVPLWLWVCRRTVTLRLDPSCQRSERGSQVGGILFGCHVDFAFAFRATSGLVESVEVDPALLFGLVAILCIVFSCICPLAASAADVDWVLPQRLHRKHLGV